jgi:hypothetical protein
MQTVEYANSLPDFTDLKFDPGLSCREVKHVNYDVEYTRTYYADFETDVSQNPHKPYLCCVVSRRPEDPNGKPEKAIITEDFANVLADYLEDGSLCYFHNLKYDACQFMSDVTEFEPPKMLERNGKIMKLTFTKLGEDKKICKKITFIDSYSIISTKLKKFGEMFKLKDLDGNPLHKELMPYKLYTQDMMKTRVIPYQWFVDAFPEKKRNTPAKRVLIDTCVQNSKAYIVRDDQEFIDIMQYAVYYCVKDCEVLMQGLEKFRSDLVELFKITRTEMPDISNFVSISSIGYAFARAYGCFDGCYELSGKPREFLQRCVSGGRCMTRNNEKLIVRGKIQDFDAVSLYPSAMYIMKGVPKGIPKVIPHGADIWKYDYFFIEINITSISCKSPTEYTFGQVYSKSPIGSKMFGNESQQNFYVDKKGLEDLLEYYNIEFEVIRGYAFTEGFNGKIKRFIKTLFDLRKKYKAEKPKNPLEQTVKLLMNSIYGKSIMKEVLTMVKPIRKAKLNQYIIQQYNHIEEITYSETSDMCFVKVLKTHNVTFTLPQFGVSVLSYSKCLMNRVMCLAEQNGIPIFYQDTDSMHLFDQDVGKLGKLFKDKFHQKLIGEELTQFHSDFTLKNAQGKPYSTYFIGLGKKCYLDVLEDGHGTTGLHVRMKEVPYKAIKFPCNDQDDQVVALFERMAYRSEEVTFDLKTAIPCFKKTKTYQQITRDVFKRKLHFNGPVREFQEAEGESASKDSVSE